MFRAPTWKMSVYFSITSIWLTSITSVTSARLSAVAASRRSPSPSSPRPWKLYGELRGRRPPPPRGRGGARAGRAAARAPAAPTLPAAAPRARARGPAPRLPAPPPAPPAHHAPRRAAVVVAANRGNAHPLKPHHLN